MIVRLEYSDAGDPETWYVPDTPSEGLDSSQLHSHREVPAHLWALYTSARTLVANLTARIDACPELSRYVEWKKDMAERQARMDKARRDADARYAKDLAVQEEIRRMGALKPLLLDCPTDEPVRIGEIPKP